MGRDFSSVPSKIQLKNRVLLVPPREKGFRYINSPLGTLIIPSDRKGSWTIDERPFRSMLVSSEGKVLSTGFPKFANLKENGFTDHYQELITALKHGYPVPALEKLDGTMIIRSVIDGHVHLRTRGSWALGRFQSAVIPVIKQYSQLMDPKVYPDHSLLFEFCSSSPKLRVVLSHDHDSLTFLNAIDNRTLRLLEVGEIRATARKLGVPMTTSVHLAGSLSDWKKEVAGWQGREGVVLMLRSGGMIKLKSDSYLNLHRLTTHFNTRAAKRMILTKGLRTKEQFTKFLTKAGADWETVRDLEPLIEATSEAHHRARERFPQLVDMVDLSCIQNPGQRDKQLIFINQLQDEAERQAALLYLDGREHEAEHALEQILIEEALEAFDDSRES